MDFFSGLSQSIKRDQWEKLYTELVKTKFIVTLGDMDALLQIYGGPQLTKVQKQFIFETFKVHKNVEDNPEELDQRKVNMKELVSSRLSRKNRRIDDLIALQ